METLAVGLQVAGTLASAQAARAEGKAAQVAANYRAAQEESLAGQERASAQRAAMEQRRRGRFALSRARAVAAASGASASDPSIVNLMMDLGQESEYAALTELYEGEERARGRETQANISRYEGRAARSAGNINAMSALTKGATGIFGSSTGQSLLQKYGGSELPWESDVRAGRLRRNPYL